MGHQWLSQPLGVWQTLCPQFLCQIPNESGPQAPPTHFLPVSVSFGGGLLWGKAHHFALQFPHL